MVSERHKAEGLGSWGTGKPGITEPLKLTPNFLFPSHEQVGILCSYWQDKLKGTDEPLQGSMGKRGYTKG